MDKALILFSGGQDSTICLFWALERYNYVDAITFVYGQRHAEEVGHAKKIATELGVKQKVIELDLLNQLTENALTRKDIAIKDGERPNTYVEGRNHLFLSLAAIYGQTKGIKNIIIGVSEAEFSGYPDCRNSFIRSLNNTLNLAMDDQFNLLTPLMWKDKAAVWEMADKMGKLEYIQNETLTCYNGIPGKGCELCPACQLRNKGLQIYLDKRVEI